MGVVSSFYFHSHRLMRDRKDVYTFLAQLAELFVQAGQNAVSVCFDACLDVNQGGRNRNICTERLVILYTQTY